MTPPNQCTDQQRRRNSRSSRKMHQYWYSDPCDVFIVSTATPRSSYKSLNLELGTHLYLGEHQSRDLGRQRISHPDHRAHAVLDVGEWPCDVVSIHALTERRALGNGYLRGDDSAASIVSAQYPIYESTKSGESLRDAGCLLQCEGSRFLIATYSIKEDGKDWSI